MQLSQQPAGCKCAPGATRIGGLGTGPCSKLGHIVVNAFSTSPEPKPCPNAPAFHALRHVSAKICDCLPQSPRQFQRDAAIASEQSMPKGLVVCRYSEMECRKIVTKVTKVEALALTLIFCEP